MAEELRIVFMVLGLIAIIALVVHGFYTVRKNKKVAEQTLSAETQTEENEEYVSKARVVGQKETAQAESVSTAKEQANEASVKSKMFALKEGISRIKPEKTEPVKERVEPELSATQLQMELPEDEQTDNLSFSASNEDADVSEQIADRENTLKQQTELEIEQTAQPTEPESEKAPSLPEEVLILNVVAPEGQQMSGAVLLPTLLTLGFKFGEYNIFHRHEDDSGSGEVLFSLANMFNPGTFDIDNIEQFTTQGVSLFLSLPVSADSTATFNMMHNAAKKIAAEFDGQVLDGQRNVLTRQTLQHYVERIREFERKQLLSR